MAHTSHPALCVINDRLLLVQSNVATGQPLWLLWPEDGKYAARFGFFKANSEILPAGETIKVVKPGPLWDERVSAMTKTAIAGASHRQRGGITISPEGEPPAETSSVWPNSRCLSRSEGGRGVQERNCVSIWFHVFIVLNFDGCRAEAGSNFLDTIAVAARDGVRRNLQQLRDILKR